MGTELKLHFWTCWENVELPVGRELAGAVLVDLLLEASRAPLRLIPRIPLFSFLPEGLKSLDNSGCSFTRVRTWRNQGDQGFVEQFRRN